MSTDKQELERQLKTYVGVETGPQCAIDQVAHPVFARREQFLAQVRRRAGGLGQQLGGLPGNHIGGLDAHQKGAFAAFGVSGGSVVEEVGHQWEPTALRARGCGGRRKTGSGISETG